MTEWHNGIAKITLPTPFPVGDVNVYLLKGDRLTLVDVGPNTEEAYQALIHQLHTLEIELSDIEQIILTHHHPDHSGLLDRFPTAIEVYAHSLNDRWLVRPSSFTRLYDQFFRQLFVEFGVKADYEKIVRGLKQTLHFSCHRSLSGYLSETMSPIGLPDWQVIETFGHAQGHISLYRESDGTLIAGDHLLAHISPNPLLEPPLSYGEERPKPLLQYNEAMQKLLSLPIHLVYTGHGEEILQAHDLIEKRLARQKERAYTVLEWLQVEPMTVFDICKRLFPSLFERQLSLTLSETVAQLDYLSDLNEISSRMENGVRLFYAKSRRS